MNLRNHTTRMNLVFWTFIIALATLGQQADGGLVGIMTPYLNAILILLFVILPVEVILRKGFGVSLIDLFR